MFGAAKLNGLAYAASAPLVTRTGKTVTSWGFDDFQIHNSPSKFGRSLFFAGTTANNQACGLETPLVDAFKWHLGTYTMEAWVYPVALNSGTEMILGNMGNDGWTYYAFGFTSAGKLQFRYYYNNQTATSAIVVETGTSGSIGSWQHIAMTHSSGTIKLWHNGVEKASAAVTGTPGYNFGNVRPFTVGYSGGGFRGFIDEVRVSSSVRYTTTFTPPTSGFTNDANTVYLLHLDHNTIINPNGGSTEVTDDGSGVTYSPATNPTAVTAVSMINNVTSTGATITIPTYADIDDYILLFDTSTTTTSTIPTGFTSIVNTTTTGIRSIVSYKKLVSGDPGSTITGMGGTTSKCLLILKPNAPVTTLTISTPAAEATVSIPATQSISMSGQTKPVLGFAHYTSTGAIATRGGTGSRAEYAGGSTTQYVKHWSYNQATPANITDVTMSDGGTNVLQSFYLRFA